MLRHWCLVLLLVVVGATSARGQDSTAAPSDTSEAWYETAWTQIVAQGGVQIAYIFYTEADNENDGVVLRLRNRNAYPVRYAFTVIFRGPEAEATAEVKGTLNAGEMKTGENDGLFWVPFRETGASVGEIGLRGVEIYRLPEASRAGD